MSLSSTLDVSGNARFYKPTSVRNSFDVSGTTTLYSTVNVSKAATMDSTLYVDEAATMNNNLSINGSIITPLTVTKSTTIEFYIRSR